MTLSSNEYLRDILGTLITINGKITPNKQDPTIKVATEAIPSIKETSGISKIGGMKEAAGVLKDLSQVSVTGLLKLSIVPFDTIGKKLNKLISDIGDINDKKAKNGIEAIKQISQIIKIFDEINPIKLAIKLATFPTKLLNKTILGISSTLGVLQEGIKGIRKDRIEAAKKLLEYPIKIAWMYAAALPAIPLFGLSVAMMKISFKLLESLMDSIRTNFDKKTAKNTKDSLDFVFSFAKDIVMITVATTLIGIVMAKLGGWKALSMGLVIMGATMLGYLGLTLLVSFVSSKMKVASNNFSVIKDFARDVVLLALATAAIGIMIDKLGGWKSIMYGLVVVTGVMVAYGAISIMANIISKKTNKGMGSLKDIAFFALGGTALLLLSWGIGALINKYPKGILDITYGVLAIGTVILAYSGIAFLADKLSKNINNGLKSLKNIVIFAVGGALLVGVSALVGSLLKKEGGIENILIGLGAISAVLVVYGGIAALAGKLKKPILQGTLALGAVMLLVAATGGLIYELVFVSKQVDTLGANPWKKILTNVGMMTAIIVAFGGITAAIGGLMMIPGAPLVMALGVATIGALSLVLYTLSSAIIKLIGATKVFPKGGMEAPMNTMKTFLDAMIPMIKGIADMDMGNIIKTRMKIGVISSLIGTLSKFAKLIQNFGGESGRMKIVTGYDKNGNPIYDKKGVEIKPVAENIATSFSSFTETILTTLESLDVSGKSAAIAALMMLMIHPVSKFTKIISSFTSSGKGMISPIRFDKNGNLVKMPPINVKQVSAAIASSFATFSTELLTSMDKIDAGWGDGKKALVLNKMMDPVTKFVNMMASVIKDDATIKSMDKNMTALSSLIGRMDVAFKPTKEKSYDKMAKTLPKVTKSSVDFINKIGNTMNKQKDNFETYIEMLEKISTHYEKLISQKEKLGGNLALVVDQSTTKNEVSNTTVNSKDFAETFKKVIPEMATSIKDEMAKLSFNMTKTKLKEKETFNGQFQSTD